MVRTVSEMVPLAGGDLGFVPTMGALHAGHLELIRKARVQHKTVCVSLFVNPLQFGAGEDLDKYPRNEERDFMQSEQAGVDIMFAPTVTEIYPRPSSIVHVPVISEPWEGRIRPGHFDGVATVVAKLFNIVRPGTAYFGWKDLQQCLVIQRMVDDLNMPVRLSFEETVREEDGLAMSSRNAYLSSEERKKAPLLRQTLLSLKDALARNSSHDEILAEARASLTTSGFNVDYLEIVSLRDLQRTTEIEGSALIAAARLGTTRLIDNLRLGLG